MTPASKWNLCVLLVQLFFLWASISASAYFWRETQDSRLRAPASMGFGLFAVLAMMIMAALYSGAFLVTR